MNIDILNAYCGPWLLSTVHAWLRVGLMFIPSWLLAEDSFSPDAARALGFLLGNLEWLQDTLLWPRLACDPREFIPGSLALARVSGSGSQLSRVLGPTPIKSFDLRVGKTTRRI